MKTRTRLLVQFILMFLATGQVHAQKDLSQFLDANYEGGSEEFLKTMYTSIKYPLQARNNCITGKSIAKVFVSESGKIDSIHHINVLGFGIEKAIVNSLLLTDNKFTNTEKMDFKIDVVFQLGSKEEYDGDLIVVGYFSINGRTVKPCKSDIELLEEFTRMVKKEKYRKAQKIIQELLKRKPHSDHYIGLSQFLNDKLEE